MEGLTLGWLNASEAFPVNICTCTQRADPEGAKSPRENVPISWFPVSPATNRYIYICQLNIAWSWRATADYLMGSEQVCRRDIHAGRGTSPCWIHLKHTLDQISFSATGTSDFSCTSDFSVLPPGTWGREAFCTIDVLQSYSLDADGTWFWVPLRKGQAWRSFPQSTGLNYQRPYQTKVCCIPDAVFHPSSAGRGDGTSK